MENKKDKKMEERRWEKSRDRDRERKKARLERESLMHNH